MVIPARENDFVNELYMKSSSLTFTKHLCKLTATQIKENYLSFFLFGFGFSTSFLPLGFSIWKFNLLETCSKRKAKYLNGWPYWIVWVPFYSFALSKSIFWRSDYIMSINVWSTVPFDIYIYGVNLSLVAKYI